ncbi:peptide chain release factor N(5)-glutamine methyltransferase [Desulfurivibrio sp. D14AmB]|uniref:peptide chain release factor N(5)-glutamine methyltransferase n=1 Tax=Desulfurivibrio sp. D14AmB TaxID=3374370 RepID=UPI00376ECBAF
MTGEAAPSPPFVAAPGATVGELRGLIIACWRQAGIEEAAREADLLLAWLLGCDRAGLILAGERPVAPGQLALLEQLVRRRAGREPIAYLLGEWEFWSLPFRVGPAVLIPRPETELLVEETLKFARQSSAHHGGTINILDLGTGSGVLAVVLARELPQARVVAVDRSPAALAIARGNAHRHGVENRVAWLAADWLSAFGPQTPPFDLVVSNPPYVEAAALASLAPEVRDFEPRQALDGGEAGLREVITLAREIPPHLRPGGRLLIEIGWDQEAAVRALFGASPAFDQVEVLPDLAGLPRILSCRRSHGQDSD